MATATGLTGWVENRSDCVRIEVEGGDESIKQFLHALRTEHPPQAVLTSVDVESLDCESPRAGAKPMFEIRASSEGTSRQPTIPPDLATCSECRREITTKSQRRYGYPFTNCTNCGPRWSIIEGVPYDRPRTSMAAFTMCDACCQEYQDPTDRRFHAQPIACADCGPSLLLIDAKGTERDVREVALQAAAEAVRAGAILALKGLGGFQLIADATSQGAVRRLRERKHRPHKPLAVMLADCDIASLYCHVSQVEQSQLTSSQAPILLLHRRDGETGLPPIAEAVAPGNPYLGVMLPNTPLHLLLVQQVARPIVCTSGNLSEEPMAIDNDDACRRLAHIADLFLLHNRPIVRPVDDSVCREDNGSLQILRRARGYAPMPLQLGTTAPAALAVGGHLKNSVALRIGSQVIIGSHVGDLDNSLSLEVHRQAITDLLEFFDVQPTIIACDLHPDYSSSQHAEQLAGGWNVPLLRVQHHHAHVLSAIAEHGLNGPVLGFAWDGTGLGVDGTIWGGESILVDGTQWSRVGHLRPFPLPGGDRAAREPRRSALGTLYECQGTGCLGTARHWFSESELKTLFQALQRPKLFPRTTSMGRLFDAVAALSGLNESVSFEGQAAMQLEFTAAPQEASSYTIPLSRDEPAIADWRPLIESVTRDRAGGMPASRISARFHNALAALTVQMARRIGCPQVVLTGGCFQNRLLTDRVRACLSESGFEVYTHKRVPPGDGGIALGQILAAELAPSQR